MAVFLASIYCTAASAAYPDKPIRIIVGSGAGGGGDTVARLVADNLTKKLGVALVIENRPGASGNIGAASVAQAKPDGYTLLFAYSGHVINPALFKDMPFDTVHDFRAVSKLGSPQSILVVNPSVPANTVREFIELARKNPEKYSMAALFGTDYYIAERLLEQKENVKFLFVPYKGGAAALNDVLSGQVSAMVNTAGATAPFVKAGRVRALAIVNSERSHLLPDVPTLAEQGVDISIGGWYALLAPAGVPDPVIDKLNQAIKSMLKEEAVVARLRDFGVEPGYVAPREFDRFIASEVDRWKAFFAKMAIKQQ